MLSVAATIWQQRVGDSKMPQRLYSNDYLFWKHCRAVLTVVAGCPALKKCIRTFLCLHFKMPAQLCHHFFFWGEINDRKGWVFLQNENAVANVIPSLTNVLFTSNLSQDPSHKNRSHCGKGINGFFYINDVLYCVFPAIHCTFRQHFDFFYLLSDIFFHSLKDWCTVINTQFVSNFT